MVEKLRERRHRKIYVFKTLMATRGTPLSPMHVEALNMIELEFSADKPKEKPVLEAWKVCLDQLADAPQDYKEPDYQTKLNAWSAKSQDCRIDLLLAMGRALHYHFDKVQLKKGAYTPRGLADLELQHSLIRTGTIDVLYGTRPLRIRVDQDETGA